MANKPVDVYDGLALAGLGAIDYGLTCWSVPTAWIFTGAVLLTLGLWPVVRQRKGR